MRVRGGYKKEQKKEDKQNLTGEVDLLDVT